MQDKSLPLGQRAELARTVLYGKYSRSLAATDMRLDEVSPAAIEAQSRQAPLKSWWDGGKAPILVLQVLTMFLPSQKMADPGNATTTIE